MSSSGSDSLGRHRNASRIGLATAARSSSKRPTSLLLNPHAAKCSGRVKTASYSSISELKAAIQTADSKQPAKAGGKRPCHSAKPQLSRQCRERKKLPLLYDIACNITNRGISLLGFHITMQRALPVL